MKKKDTYSMPKEGNNEKIRPGEFFSEQDHAARKYLKEMDEISKTEQVNIDKAWDKLYNRIENDKLLEKKKANVFMQPAFRIAASVILLMAMTFTAIYLGTDGFGTNKTSIVSAGADQKNIRIDLPDGSSVFLNRNSSIEYPEHFTGQTRTVKLQGEAFFDIETETGRPFIVETTAANITVAGTSFNVNSSDNNVEVFVSTGKVVLNSNDGKESVILEPGEIGSLVNNTASKNINNDPNYMAWKTEILEFNGDSLAKVFSDLERVHNINIEAEDSGISELRLTSVYDRQSPETIIRIICLTFNLEYEKEGNTFTLFTN